MDDHDPPFFVKEQAAVRSLAESFTDHRPMTIEDVIALAAQLTDAVAAASAARDGSVEALSR